MTTETEVQAAILNRMQKGGLIDTTFEQRQQVQEGVKYVNTWNKSIPGGWNSHCKGTKESKYFASGGKHSNAPEALRGPYPNTWNQ